MRHRPQLVDADPRALPNGSVARTVTPRISDPSDRLVITSAVFDDPAAGKRSAIIRQVRSLVRQARAGASIRIAMFVMSGDTGDDLANELIAAHGRNVSVQIVVDGWQAHDPAVRKLIGELGTKRSARSWVHGCTGLSPEGTTAACIGSKGMHNKFYLFSRTGGADHVVVQSSANFTGLNSATYWNNAVTIAGNTSLYQAYDSYFEDLAAERRNDDYYRVAATQMAGGSVTAYFFPRAGTDASTDTIIELLAPVGRGSGTVIRIGMSVWDLYRIAIADRLRELADTGCIVQVVHGVMDSEVRQRLLAGRRVELRALNNASQLPGRIHSKYMLIQGTYAGVNGAKWVITGSHNYTQTSLRRNDEALLRFDLAAIYDQYRSSFLAMWEVAQP